MTSVHTPSSGAALAGQDVAVTGAGRGLGQGVARVLARAGARVWLCAEVADEVALTRGEIEAEGGWAHAQVVDLTDPPSRRDWTDRLTREARNLTGLVNNAAVLERQPVAQMQEEHWERVLSVNLTAPLLLTRDLLPAISAGGGSIVNVSSRAGVLAFAGQAAYCASKFGLEAVTRCLALELAGGRVSVNTLTPGSSLKPTSLTRRQAEALPPEERARWIDPVELGPAFVLLLGLRGEVSGFRFDAARLAGALHEWGRPETMRRIREIADHTPDEAGP